MIANIFTLSAYNLGHRQEQILSSVEIKLAELEASHPDLVVLPEEVLISGGDRNNPMRRQNDDALITLAESYSSRLKSYIALGVETPSQAYPGHYYNSVLLFDRSGHLTASYHKRHITFRATDGIPGESIIVADTDMGRLGFMICFDIGWRDDWRALSDAGAELVVWPSAYHGGRLLNGYAALYGYYIVSSVWNAKSRIIDPFGRDIAESSSWDAYASSEISLGGEIFHFDRQEDAVSRLRREYGDKVVIYVEPEGNIFYLAPRSTEPTLSEIKSRFGLVSYKDYHAEATMMNRDIRAAYPEVKV